MATFLLKRLGLMVLTLFILSLIVFFAGRFSLVIPGAPSSAIWRRKTPCRPSTTSSG